MKADINLWILVLVCIINSLGLGIIIPVMYSYGKTFGLNGTTLGFLMASFSIAQFFATPVLGSLSDKWGRKPLLKKNQTNTNQTNQKKTEAQSQKKKKTTHNHDGLTGGNVSVAQAMVAD